ncbi:MFS transporter [Alkalicoccobacillus murimartini]|uniref:MFS family permease n=1 Tax=Alkalicoccobacillus murimartini TaxID=171685 RepID=A0ABT9YKM1_9BACI|nr:MFS transporter [Alkalicoccobacillus murimartini]MDQ0208286.1 MFS family permease [Alkalicoccobacillus murimartini]
MKKNHPGYRFAMLIVMVAIAGFAQGMLLPLLSIMLEEAGVSSSLNGLNATALYIGILLASPFIERPVRTFGYKPVITLGLIVMTISLLLLPLWTFFWFWFVLRLIIGIADNMVHFATQVWITSTSTAKNRGRNISIYGLAFGLGFGCGPLMINLLLIAEWLPFVISAALTFVTWLFVSRLVNEFPSEDIDTRGPKTTWERYRAVVKVAWFSLLPGFAYGYLEASLHGNFPVYALRSGLGIDQVSLLLPAFVVGGLLTQLPLGLASDKFGRRIIIITIALLGSVCFFLMIAVEHSPTILFVLFLTGGGCVGSLYSLGVAYMADLVPIQLLPTANVMMAVSFGLGSMTGPLIGGWFIDLFDQGSIYYSIGSMLLLLVASGFLFRQKSVEQTI